MPAIHVKGLDELVAKLRELASGKYLDGVIRASRARLMQRLSEAKQPNGANHPKPAAGRWLSKAIEARASILENAQRSPRLVIALGPIYSRHLPGPGRQQTALQRRRGWTPVDEILAEDVPRVEADLVKAVERILK